MQVVRIYQDSSVSLLLDHLQTTLHVQRAVVEELLSCLGVLGHLIEHIIRSNTTHSCNDMLTTWPLDMSPWYKPKFRISKRLLSTRVIIRNLSNVWEFGAVLLTSNLYMFAIIGSATHHRTPLIRRILYFLVARYLTLFVEMYWVGKVIIKWDRERTSRWSTRLYGKANVNVWYSIRKDVMHPFFVTKIIPLLIGTVSLAVHYIHGWTWAKWVGIIAFTEIGLRLMFTCVNTSVLYPVVDGGWCTVTRADLSDMPEDMTNYSRGWRERNERDQRRRLHRRNRLLGNVTAQEGDRSLEREAAGIP